MQAVCGTPARPLLRYTDPNLLASGAAVQVQFDARQLWHRGVLHRAALPEPRHGHAAALAHAALGQRWRCLAVDELDELVPGGVKLDPALRVRGDREGDSILAASGRRRRLSTSYEVP